MALGNGVLVHGPSAWACAVRTDDGELKVVARRKRFSAASVDSPLLSGVARIAEVFALLPQVKRALPEAQLPMERPRVLASMLGSAIVLRGIRASTMRPLARELATAALSIAPAALALRGGELAAYHGAEHVSIGSYEQGEARPKEHERCGSHLIGRSSRRPPSATSSPPARPRTFAGLRARPPPSARSPRRRSCSAG